MGVEAIAERTGGLWRQQLRGHNFSAHATGWTIVVGTAHLLRAGYTCTVLCNVYNGGGARYILFMV